MTYLAEVTESKTLQLTAQEVQAKAKGHELVAVIVGGESGVGLADSLSEFLELRTNGTRVPQRRDKKVQQELVKAAGLRSLRQAVGRKYADVEEFLNSEPMPVVVKPLASAGSDGVKLCRSIPEARDHFNLLMWAQKQAGAAVLCQEFKKGKEYVIDTVSMDGVHKIAMLWVYDKRAVNGAAFVYHGMLPVPSSSPEAQLLIPYITGVLDALEIKNGPTHGEAIISAEGPVLVELNCCAHGGDGVWIPLARALTGSYSQVDAVAESFLDPEAFKKFPDVCPAPFSASGQEVLLVSFTEGKVVARPGYDKIKAMKSFVFLQETVQVGTNIERTVDLLTNVGSAILMHADPEILSKDVEAIRAMENDFSMFELEEHGIVLTRNRARSRSPGPGRSCSPVRMDSGNFLSSPVRLESGIFRRRAISTDREDIMEYMQSPVHERKDVEEIVVVVDPFSTGCSLALEAFNRGYKVIALWSAGVTDALKAHRPLACASLEYHAEVTELDTVETTCAAIKTAAGKCKIVATIVGADTGVPCADAVSEHLGLRTNGTQIAQRRDKKIQQQLVRAAGLRSVRQAGGTKLSDVEDFLARETMPVVVKPVESAGSEGVKLCHTIEEARNHFEVLYGAQMTCGAAGAEVLCQEFLRGKEYVIDNVSMNGKHKTTMIWVYDKRAVNGSAFVYYGMIPVSSDSPEAKVLIPYIHGVLDALQIKFGPTHGEAIITSDGPCLVEMNCRAHGGDGNWIPLANALTGGYNQVGVTLDAYLRPEAFDEVPDVFSAPFKAAGQEVLLVSFSRGIVKEMPGYARIRELPSFVYLETGITEGSRVDFTVDLFTCVGSLILEHPDLEQLARDVEVVRQMEKNNELFIYEEQGEVLGRPRAMSETKPLCVEMIEPEKPGGWCSIA